MENTSSPEECFSHPASGMPVLQILSLWRSKVSLFLCRAAGPSLNNYIPRPYSPCNEAQCCWWCVLNGTYSRFSMCRQTRRQALLYWPAHSSTPPPLFVWGLYDELRLRELYCATCNVVWWSKHGALGPPLDQPDKISQIAPRKPK